jgi:putative sigma-54 modulation protein
MSNSPPTSTLTDLDSSPKETHVVQIRIATRHGTLSETTQNRIKRKADKLLRLFDRLTEIEIIVDLEDAATPRVDIKCAAEHKHDFVAHEQSEHLMGAVDAAIQKLEQQVRRYKERVQQRHRNPEIRRTEAIQDGE